MIDDKLKTNFKQFREEMKEDYGKIANVALIEAGREIQDTGFIENNPKVRDVIRKTTKQTKEQMAEHVKKKNEIEYKKR